VLSGSARARGAHGVVVVDDLALPERSSGPVAGFINAQEFDVRLQAHGGQDIGLDDCPGGHRARRATRMSWEEQGRAEVFVTLFGLPAWLEAFGRFQRCERVVCLAGGVWHITAAPPPHLPFLQQPKMSLPWSC